MKKSIFTLIVAIIATMFATSCNKIKSMDNIRGYEVSGDNRYEVLDMDDNREPLTEAITLSVPDTIGRQGTSGVVPGTLTADIAAGAGFVKDFDFTYNNGEKTFSYSVAGNFGLDYEGTTVYPLHGFTLTGEFSVVSERTTPTYLQVSKVEWTLRNDKNGAIAAQKTSYHKIYEDPKDSVIVVQHDTVWQHVVDTVFVWQHDTVIRVIYDTVVLGGDTNSYMSYITKSHKSWDGINGGYVYGTDSVKLTKMDADGAVLSVSRGTYSHRTPVTYNVPTMTSAVAGNCYTFVNGTANCAGTNATCTLGATQVVGIVMLDGVDITAYLQGCQPYAQRICFSNLNGENGTYTIYIVGHDGEDAGTITGPYSISDGRHLVSTDTTWNCGSVTAANYSNGIITYSITRTGTVTRHYSAAPLTETSTISGSTTYTYSVTMTGTAVTSMIGQTKNVNSNTANFNGFSVTMTPGAQNFCSHVHTTVTATSTGLVVNGEYNGSTTTVTIPMTPATVIDLEGDLEAAYISDSYTGNCLGRTTWLNLLYTLSDGSHVMYQVQLTSTAATAALTTSSFSSVSVTPDGYTRYNTNKNNVNWGLCRITTAGTPSAAGYCTYSSDASIGIYEATINDGVNRVHCNAAGYANPNDELEHPVHFRNVNGGTTHVVANNVHGVNVNLMFQ